VAVVETLLGKGYTIQIFDKNVHLSNITGTNREFIEKHIPHLAGLLTDKLDVIVDESEILIVTTKEEEFTKALTNVNGKIIYDLVRLGNDFLIEENYYGINW
jgi:GDP-mannose 6-dehydrogenase